MNIINQKLLDQSDAFFKSLTKEDKIALLHDTDPDGTTSGKIIYEALKRMGHEIELFLVNHRKDHAIDDEKIILMKAKGITKLITTDKVVDCDPVQLRKIEEFAQICIFDHHVIENDVSSDKTVFLKPQLIFDTDKPAYYCSAKFSYDLLMRVVDVSDLDWVCLAGMLGDMAHPQWPEFVHAVFKRYNIEKKTNLFETKIGLLTQLISFAEAMNEPEECFETFVKATDLDDAIRRLEKYAKVKEEVDRYTSIFEKETKYYVTSQVYVLKLDSPYYIKSLISSKLSVEKVPSATLIVLQQVGHEMTISARRHDGKYSMNELVKLATKDLRGDGGGHKPAAGARVHIDDTEAFIKNVIEICKDWAQKS